MQRISVESRYFLLSAIFLFIYLAFLLYQNFLFNMVIAIILIISTLNINKLLLGFVKNRLFFTIISTFILAIIFIMPITFFILSASEYLSNIDIKEVALFITKAKIFILDIISNNNYLKVYENDIAGIIDPKYIANNLLSLGKIITSVSVNFIKDIIMVLIFYMLILLYLKPLSMYVSGIVPFRDEQVSYFANNVSSNMSITFHAVIITAALEGFLFSILVSYFNYDAWLFGVLFAFASLIPIVGGALMWLPLSLYEYFNGSLQNALIISLYTIIIISIITDTFIKAYIIKIVKENTKNSKLEINEVIILFSIIAGLSEFGFWGVLIGPIISITLLSLFDFYHISKIHVDKKWT